MRSDICGAVVVAVGLALACGEASRGAASGSGGSLAFGGSSASGGAPAAGGTALVVSAGDAGACLGTASCTSNTHALVESSDTATCLSRESVACDGSRFEEQLQGLSDPRFERCQSAVPYDGCGRLLLEFDGDGCLSRLTTPLSPEEGIFDHFVELRACLKPIFEEVRFECLSGARLRFDESCFVR